MQEPTYEALADIRETWLFKHIGTREKVEVKDLWKIGENADNWWERKTIGLIDCVERDL